MLQEWTLSPENGGNIQLTFISFDLQKCDNDNYEEEEYSGYYDEEEYSGYYYQNPYECTNCLDYVEVSYGSNSEKLCGDIVPETITSCGGRSMVIKFHSNSRTTGTGFRAAWEELPRITTTCDAANCLTYPADNPCSNYPDNADEVTNTIIT